MHAQVEVRDESTGKWKLAHRCLPAYRYETRGWWLFKRRVIVNKEEAEQDSYKRAHNLARAIHEPDVFFYGENKLRMIRPDVRIVECHFDLRDWYRVVWLNGHWVR